ncbi:ABC transporter permease [Symbiobacterium terraclitae]|uniref:ABC transporter permease n=1 Tax=Symbiobacterium terraclitae TaxID=557451 RepID=UPI0035B55004
MDLRHNLSCYCRMALAQARARMQYRANFVAHIISMVLTYGGQFVALYWLTQRFNTVGGWRLEEIVLLYALAILAWGVSVSFFWSLVGFEEQVRMGTYDRALLRPINPLLTVLGSQSPINGMGQFVFSIAAFIFAVRVAGVRLTAVKLAYLLLTALGGGLILGAALIATATLAFWTTRTYTFYWNLVFPARQLINYPISIYHRALQVVLTVLVPFAFINFFPAHVLLDRVAQLPVPALAWATPAVGLASIAAAYGFWQLGTRNYTSTGS